MAILAMTKTRLTVVKDMPVGGSVLRPALHPADPATAIAKSMVSHARAGDKPEPRGAEVSIGRVLVIISLNYTDEVDGRKEPHMKGEKVAEFR